MLEKQQLPINFTDGVDLDSDDILSVKLAKLENGRFDKGGTISKREGFASLSKEAVTTTDIINNTTNEPDVSAALNLCVNDDSLGLQSGRAAYLYDNKLDKWIRRRNGAIVTSRTTEIGKSSLALSTALAPEVYFTDDQFLYECSNQIVVKNKKTGAFVSIIDYPGAALTFKKVLKVNDALYFYGTTSTDNLRFIEWDRTTATGVDVGPASPDRPIGVRVSGNAHYVARYAAGSLFWEKHIGTTLDESGSTAQSILINTELAITETDVEVIVVGTEQVGSDARQVFYRFDKDGTFITKTNGNVLGAGYTGNPTTKHMAHWNDSALWVASSIAYTSASFSGIFSRTISTLFSSAFAVLDNGWDFYPAFSQTDFNYDDTPIFIVKSDRSFVAVRGDKDAWHGFNDEDLTCGGISQRSFMLRDSSGLINVKVVTLELDNAEVKNAEAASRLTVVPNHFFDGLTYRNTLLIRPVVNTLTAAAGSIAAGTYNFVAVYTRTDKYGNEYRSAVSDQANITLGSTQGVTVKVGVSSVFIDDLDLFDGKVEIYAKQNTAVNFIKQGEIDVVSFGIIVPFVDVTISSLVTSGKLLYTTGGVLETDPAPSFASCAVVNNRVWIVSNDDGRIWYTKPLEEGLAPEFSAFLTIRFGDGGGDPVAVAGLDGRVVVFKPDSIYAISGEGSNSTGAGGAFSPPFRIAADTGCINPASVVLTPAGLMFLSKKGFYLLDRGLNTLPVGDEVRGFDQNVTSATLNENDEEVIFTTKSGLALIYNYKYGQWSTWGNYSANASVIWRDSIVHAKADGTVNKSGGLSDNGDPIKLELRTAWIKAGGVQLLHRFYRMFIIGRDGGDHDLLFRTRYDYGTDVDTYTQPKQAGVYQYEVHIKRQKVQSIQFDIEATPSVNGALRLSNMTLVVGLKRKNKGLPASNKR